MPAMGACTQTRRQIILQSCPPLDTRRDLVDAAMALACSLCWMEVGGPEHVLALDADHWHRSLKGGFPRLWETKNESIVGVAHKTAVLSRSSGRTGC